jgi:hypothetical protein
MINRKALREALVLEIARMLAEGEAECNDQGVIVLTAKGEKVSNTGMGGSLPDAQCSPKPH